VARGPLAAALEMECSNADACAARSASGTVLDQLNRWRVLFWSCLMDGRPPPKPAVKIDESPASECPASDALLRPAEAAQGESDEPEQGRAAESLEQPKAQSSGGKWSAKAHMIGR
jgi:hypothetical protein